MHCGDERRPIGLGAANARLPRRGLASLHRRRQLGPTPHDVRRMPEHRQYALRGIFREPAAKLGRNNITSVLFLEQLQGHHGVQQHREARRSQSRLLASCSAVCDCWPSVVHRFSSAAAPITHAGRKPFIVSDLLPIGS